MKGYILFLECRTYRENKIRMSPLAQALSVNIYFHLRFQVALWNTTHMMILFKCTSYMHCTTRDNFLHMQDDCRAHGLGGIMQLLVRSDYT